MADFKPTELGITAFLAPRGIDFVLDGPNMEHSERVTAFYDSPKKKLTLSGKTLKIISFEHEEGSEDPARLIVKHGRQEIRLGRRKHATGPVSFYRSLEPKNLRDAPRTAAQITEALSLFTQ